MKKQPDFIAELKYRTKEEGGRIGYAASGYRPHVEFDHIPIFKSSGQQIFLNKETVRPGESVIAEITLLSYYGYNKNIKVGSTFIFCEGAKVIGKGKVIEILNKKLEDQYSEEERKNLLFQLESAIEAAKEKKTLTIQNLSISFNEFGYLRLIGFSKWIKLESISKQKALEEIEELKEQYAHWLGVTTMFINLNGWLRPEFELVYLDKRDWVRICIVRDDKVNWNKELQYH